MLRREGRATPELPIAAAPEKPGAATRTEHRALVTPPFHRSCRYGLWSSRTGGLSARGAGSSSSTFVARTTRRTIPLQLQLRHDGRDASSLRLQGANGLVARR